MTVATLVILFMAYFVQLLMREILSVLELAYFIDRSIGDESEYMHMLEKQYSGYRKVES